jgi:hypothetical protein
MRKIGILVFVFLFVACGRSEGTTAAAGIVSDSGGQAIANMADEFSDLEYPEPQFVPALSVSKLAANGQTFYDVLMERGAAQDSTGRLVESRMVVSDSESVGQAPDISCGQLQVWYPNDYPKVPADYPATPLAYPYHGGVRVVDCQGRYYTAG